MSSLSYQKTLAIVEKFMIDSGIREYCTKVCKGRCCDTCRKTNKETYHLHEKRRLSCSIFLCTKITDLFSTKTKSSVQNVATCINEQYKVFYKLLCCRKNAYFTAPPKVFFKVVRFPASIKIELERINTKTIKKKIDKLAEEHNKRKTK